MARKVHKPVEIFPWLYDISPMLVDTHPIYHPNSQAYSDYWTEQERKCVEGIWFEDMNKSKTKGGFRYAPGSLYFMMNMGIMNVSDDDNAPDLVRPRCRDIDWVMDYGYMTARGFSGFAWDEEYTCHRAVRSLEENGPVKLSPLENIAIEKFEKELIRPDGYFKKYINPIEYLYHTKPENLGPAIYHNEALDLMTMGPRGFGKSWKIAHIFSYEFRMSGLRKITDKYLYDLPEVQLMMMSTDTDKTAETLAKFSIVEDHLRRLGSFKRDGKFIPGFWSRNTKGLLKVNNVEDPYRHSYQSREGDTWNKRTGSQNAIYHVVATKHNFSKAAGPRPLIICHEEVGLAENESHIAAVNKNALKKETKVGTEWDIGTGGDQRKIGDVKKKFYNPRANYMVEYENLWAKTGKTIGQFIPKTHVLLAFKDKNGNTNVPLALKQELHERKMLEDAGDVEGLEYHKKFNCLNPEEMLGGSVINIFPTAQIADTIGHIEIYRDTVASDWQYGRFIRDPKSLLNFQFYQDATFNDRYPENPYEDKIRKNKNRVLVFQKPILHNGSTGQYMNPYKIVYDPVKDDGSGTSLGCIIVYKGFVPGSAIDEYSDNIVAAYIGRTEEVEDMHMIAAQLGAWYQAKVLFENNIYDFKKWADRKKFSNILQKTPWLAIDKGYKKSASRKYKYGVNIQGRGDEGLKNYAIRLLRKKVRGEVSYEGDPVMWIERVKFLRLLYELNLYGELDNYDAISAMLILVLWLDQEEDPKLQEMLDKMNEKKTKNSFVKSLTQDLGTPNVVYNEI